MPKNRNPLMLYARHKHLVERFNYWMNVKRRRYDDVVKILAYQECFYTEVAINHIVKNWKPDAILERGLKQELTFEIPKNKIPKNNGPKLFED